MVASCSALNSPSPLVLFSEEWNETGTVSHEWIGPRHVSQVEKDDPDAESANT